MKRVLMRSGALVLLLLFLLPLFPVSALAAEAEPEEAAYAATVEISSLREFLDFAENCSLDSYSRNVLFLLTEDIDLGSTDFSPIQLFLGTFDGNGHSIRGLHLSGDGSLQGLFRRVSSSGEIRNLFVYGAVSPGGTRQAVGGIAGENSGTIRNCAFTGSVEGTRYVGGIAGKNAGSIIHCSFFGTVVAERDGGGIAGTSSGYLLSCSNSGDICSVPIDSVTEAEFNFNTFDISQLTTEDFVNISNIGGIAGSSSGTVDNCENRGNVGYKYQGFNIGGIAGKTSGFVNNCRNLGPVWGQRDVGGIAGQLEPYVSTIFTEDLLQELRTEMDALNASVNAVSGSVNAAFGTGVDTVSQMALYTRDLATEVAKIVPLEPGQLPDLPSPGEGEGLLPDLPDTPSETPDMSQITADLNLLLNGSAQMISLMGSTVSGVTGALRSVNTHTNAILKILGRAADNASASRDLTEDISVQEAYALDTGAIGNCVNRSPVRADTNAGGILGLCAVELSFDVAGEIDLSSYFLSDARTTFFAVVRDCVNSGDVTVRDSYVGGIVGNMAQGAVVSCGSSCQVLCENGDYAGGIAGSSSGTVMECCARSAVSGGKFLGGICGSGSSILSCLSHVNVLEGKEYIGAVAGQAEGEIRENLFLRNPLGGIDGASLEGQAEPIDYTRLPEMENVPDFFLNVSVRFIKEDGAETEWSVRLGGFLRGTVYVPKNEKGQPWQWDDVPTDRLFENKTITGHYVAPVPVLASAGADPVYLVEGTFSESQQLSVLDPVCLPSPSGLADPVILRAAALLVEGCAEDLQVHMRAPSGGHLLLLLPDGTTRELPYETDGSYLVFTLPNGASFAYTEITLQSFPTVLVAAVSGALLLTAVLTVFLLRRRRKRSASSAPGPSEENDGPPSA